MRADTPDERFAGIRRLYGAAGMARIAASHIVVIGIGGVGSWVAEALARSGVGEVTLIDLDDICVSNVNRQIHALSGTFGQSKIAVMAERMGAIHPQMTIHTLEDFISTKNIPQLITAKFDYVIDAIDSVQSKAGLIAHCRRNRLRLITIGGAGGQIDPTRVATGDLARICGDPLLAKVRHELRRKYGFSRNPRRKFEVEAVYSDEQLIYPWADGRISHARPPDGGPARLDCAQGFGAASFVTGTFAFVAVGRVLKKLSGISPGSMHVVP